VDWEGVGKGIWIMASLLQEAQQSSPMAGLGRQLIASAANKWLGDILEPGPTPQERWNIALLSSTISTQSAGVTNSLDSLEAFVKSYQDLPELIKTDYNDPNGEAWRKRQSDILEGINKLTQEGNYSYKSARQTDAQGNPLVIYGTDRNLQQIAQQTYDMLSARSPILEQQFSMGHQYTKTVDELTKLQEGLRTKDYSTERANKLRDNLNKLEKIYSGNFGNAVNERQLLLAIDEAKKSETLATHLALVDQKTGGATEEERKQNLGLQVADGTLDLDDPQMNITLSGKMDNELEKYIMQTAVNNQIITDYNGQGDMTVQDAAATIDVLIESGQDEKALALLGLMPVSKKAGGYKHAQYVDKIKKAFEANGIALTQAQSTIISNLATVNVKRQNQASTELSRIGNNWVREWSSGAKALYTDYASKYSKGKLATLGGAHEDDVNILARLINTRGDVIFGDDPQKAEFTNAFNKFLGEWTSIPNRIVSTEGKGVSTLVEGSGGLKPAITKSGQALLKIMTFGQVIDKEIDDRKVDLGGGKSISYADIDNLTDEEVRSILFPGKGVDKPSDVSYWTMFGMDHKGEKAQKIASMEAFKVYDATGEAEGKIGSNLKGILEGDEALIIRRAYGHLKAMYDNEQEYYGQEKNIKSLEDLQLTSTLVGNVTKEMKEEGMGGVLNKEGAKGLIQSIIDGGGFLDFTKTVTSTGKTIPAIGSPELTEKYKAINKSIEEDLKSHNIVLRNDEEFNLLKHYEKSRAAKEDYLDQTPIDEVFARISSERDALATASDVTYGKASKDETANAHSGYINVLKEVLGEGNFDGNKYITNEMLTSIASGERKLTGKKENQSKVKGAADRYLRARENSAYLRETGIYDSSDKSVARNRLAEAERQRRLLKADEDEWTKLVSAEAKALEDARNLIGNEELMKILNALDLSGQSITEREFEYTQGN